MSEAWPKLRACKEDVNQKQETGEKDGGVAMVRVVTETLLVVILAMLLLVEEGSDGGGGSDRCRGGW